MAEERDVLDGDDLITEAFRRHRPVTPQPSSLEQRLAVAAILAMAAPKGEGRPAPQRLGRLEVQGKIGGGGMGIVYRAWDPALRRHVAVKVLRGFGDDGERARVADEARSLARLSHPNVVTVHDIIDDAGELCIVMEHVAGGTLSSWLALHPEAGWRPVVELFVQAGHGVVAAHAKGVVHQDLKPDNILIGDDGRARVVDFGLARHDLDDAGAIHGGTPHYMAPELLAGAAATGASDQYAFCVALKDALATRREVPDVVSAAVDRGLATAPADRHPSFSALVDLLHEALGGRAPDRARRLLLERVERLWLAGVLERSLEGGGAVDVAVKEAPSLVEPPWQRWGVEPPSAAPDPDATSTIRGLPHLLKARHDSLLIVGPPGSGKTTALLHLCRELWRAAAVDVDEPVPVVLSLSTYQPEARAERAAAHFRQWVIDELVGKYGLPRPAATRWLDDHAIVLLLDGLDETDARHRDGVVDTLDAFRATWPVGVVVTCRDTEYEALGRRLAFGGAVEMQPLDDEGVARLFRARRAGGASPVWREGGPPPALRNPLLLSLLARDGTVDDGEVPPLGVAYARYVDEAFTEVPPQERSVLEGRLAFLAHTMRAHSTSDLWLERLHFTWLPHRWEQRAAWLTGLVVVFGITVGLNLLSVPFGNLWASALNFGVGVALSSFVYTRGRITPVESLRWSWRRALRLLPVTTLCATLIGLAEGARVNFVANLVGAGFTGAILGVAFALEASDREGRVRPNAGIRRSLSLALRTSFGFGVPAGLLFALVIDPWIRVPLLEVAEGDGPRGMMVGLSVGGVVFTALFLIYGGFAVIMHAVLRLWLAGRTPLGLDLQRTLDRAVELGLLRRVGGGYVFLHRTLLDEFADRAGVVGSRSTSTSP